MSARLDSGEMIFGALGTRLADLAARIDAAEEVAGLARLAPALREIGAGLLAGDAGAGLASRVLTAFNDRLTARLVVVVGKAHRLPAAPWCWLAFGSEGRGEQTFVTDQDNGLIFSAAGAAEARAMRPLFQPFARAVNEALAACGLPLCSGEIMAGNPAWCLSLEEWRRRFGAWIRTPDPEALLNATIFFDFRCLYGDAKLATELRQHLLGLTAANDVFIRMMAGNALGVAPPLGMFGDIVAAGDAGGGVDLKKQGARLFVDAARIFALAAGLAPVGTVARLQAAAQARTMDGAEATASAQAFAYLQQLRLDRQAGAIGAGLPPGNCLGRKDINEFEYRTLKAALKQAQRLQQHMKLVFRVDA
ncbi:MAG: hypothetical protein A2045_02635 [Rhodocyclales bacterium GWA2_65_20]|nr:MAG: hypothetical protein A2045_02635 [Rhodocyclales bacterium GWA2_65_20]